MGTARGRSYAINVSTLGFRMGPLIFSFTTLGRPCFIRWGGEDFPGGLASPSRMTASGGACPFKTTDVVTASVTLVLELGMTSASSRSTAREFERLNLLACEGISINPGDERAVAVPSINFK